MMCSEASGKGGCDVGYNDGGGCGQEIPPKQIVTPPPLPTWQIIPPSMQ